MCKECDRLDIPEYLHQKGKPADPHFNLTELIFRRYLVGGEISDWKNDNQISAQIFKVDNDSCVRGKYSREPKDVLYNDTAATSAEHLFHWGIVSFNVADFNNINLDAVFQNNVRKDFVLKLAHTPHECIYPHVDIQVLEEGQQLDLATPPRSTRSIIRRKILDICAIIKYPQGV